MNKTKYLLKTILKSNQKFKCPVCSNLDYLQIDQKILGLTKLVECTSCKLRYRTPQDSVKSNIDFYQSEYEQDLVTDLPSEDQLEVLMKNNFVDFKYSASIFEKFITSISKYLGRKISIFDYGANWGYKAYQFQSYDFVEFVKCYELSEPRRKFGENNLGIKYINKISESNQKYDLFFSSHVIEHMYNPLDIKDWANHFLKKDGILLITCPNGSNSAKNNLNWSKLWGQVHPNFISDEFLIKNFRDFEGTIFDECDIENKEIDQSLFKKNICSLPPKSNSLCFVAKKKK